MKLRLRELLARWASFLCRWSVLATIVVSSTQWDVLSVRGVHISLVDPLILFAVLCWFFRVLARADWMRMTWPLPWQEGQVVCSEKMPLDWTTRPLPPQ